MKNMGKMLDILSGDGNNALTARKAASIADTQNFAITGFIMESRGGDKTRCLVEKCCVRCLTDEEMWHIMHTTAQADGPRLIDDDDGHC